MRIASTKVSSYRLALTRPLVLKGKFHDYRQGLIVEVSDDEGRCGIGEVAPLPGFSRETFEEARRAVVALCNELVGRDLPESVESLGEMANCNQASVRYGVETAILRLVAQRQGVPLCRLLSDRPHNRVPVHGLLTGDAADVLKTTEALLANGFTAFKLKVGRENVREDIDLAHRVRELIGDGAILRVDANRAWSTKEACHFADEVADMSIDYIEEPVESLALLMELLEGGNFPLPVALDESLLEILPKDIVSLGGVEAVVLKPTMLGLSHALEFTREAADHKIKAVISSSFESSVGLTALAHLAAAMNETVTPAGLDTLGWLADDILETPLAISNGNIDIGGLPVSPQLRHHLLKEVRNDG